MMKAAFSLSEQLDLPVLLRLTTRVCHSKSIVETGGRAEIEVPALSEECRENPHRSGSGPRHASDSPEAC